MTLSRPATKLANALCLVPIAACAPPMPECASVPYDQESMRADVEWLAAPELDGRVPGTAGDAEARRMVSSRFECFGLSTIDGGSSYEQPFTDASDRSTANVVGVVEGADDTLAQDIVLVSAHLDHLGDGKLGANDNASGVTGLLAIAQDLADQDAPARTVVFAAFGSEESGYEGSDYFYWEGAGFDSTDIVYSINLDMIGSYDSEGIVYALGTMPETPARPLLESAMADFPDLEVGLGEAAGESDHETFCRQGVPYVFFWTEDPACYHRRCDTADVIDYDNLVEIAALAGTLTASLANTAVDLRASVSVGTDVCGIEE